MFCPSCGCRNDDGAKFCCSCGAAITPVNSDAHTNNPTFTTPQFNKQFGQNIAVSKNGIIAALSIIAACFMFLLTWLEDEWLGKFNFSRMISVSKNLGYFVDDAGVISVVMKLLMIAFIILAIITAVQAVIGKKNIFGIITGCLGVLMVAVFVVFLVELEIGLECIGMGAYIFLALSIVGIVFSCKK